MHFVSFSDVFSLLFVQNLKLCIAKLSTATRTNMTGVLIEKVGVYSTILGYFGYMWNWKRVYTSACKKTNKFWKERAGEFKAMHTYHCLDLPALNYLLGVANVHDPSKLSQTSKRLLRERNDEFTNADYQGKDIIFNILLTNEWLFDLLLDFNMPKLDNVLIKLFIKLSESSFNKLQDLVANFLKPGPDIFDLRFYHFLKTSYYSPDPL